MSFISGEMRVATSPVIFHGSSKALERTGPYARMTDCGLNEPCSAPDFDETNISFDIFALVIDTVGTVHGEGNANSDIPTRSDPGATVETRDMEVR